MASGCSLSIRKSKGQQGMRGIRGILRGKRSCIWRFYFSRQLSRHIMYTVQLTAALYAQRYIYIFICMYICVYIPICCIYLLSQIFYSPQCTFYTYMYFIVIWFYYNVCIMFCFR